MLFDITSRRTVCVSCQWLIAACDQFCAGNCTLQGPGKCDFSCIRGYSLSPSTKNCVSKTFLMCIASLIFHGFPVCGVLYACSTKAERRKFTDSCTALDLLITFTCLWCWSKKKFEKDETWMAHLAFDYIGLQIDRCLDIAFCQQSNGTSMEPSITTLYGISAVSRLKICWPIKN